MQGDGVSKLSFEYRIIVRIYVNMIDFSRKYQSAGILESFDAFERFIRGFNKIYLLFDIIDAGNEKKCFDDKIRSKSRN